MSHKDKVRVLWGVNRQSHIRLIFLLFISVRLNDLFFCILYLIKSYVSVVKQIFLLPVLELLICV